MGFRCGFNGRCRKSTPALNPKGVGKVGRKVLIYVDEPGEARAIEYPVARVFCAGFSGRDRSKVMAHVKELAELGVPEPAELPTLYRVTLDRLCMDKAIEVQGWETSGEVEFVLLVTEDDILVSVGSDHTDRELEQQSIQKAKQVAPKICADRFWRYSDVKGHWDDLMLRAWIERDGERVLYQEGSVSAILPVESLLEVVVARAGGPLMNNVIFSGTLAAINGLCPSAWFWMEIEDPVLGRKLSHEYSVKEVKGQY